MLDGVGIQVEALDGGRYHTYEYVNPGRQPWPEAALAGSILRLVYALDDPKQGTP